MVADLLASKAVVRVIKTLGRVFRDGDLFVDARSRPNLTSALALSRSQSPPGQYPQRSRRVIT